jgi:hypothetical protein
MFTPIKKWVYQDQEQRHDVQPIQGFDYGEWLPAARRLEMTVHVDGYTRAWFKIIEEQVTTQNGDFWQQFSREIILQSVAFYIPHGEMYLILQGLADDGFRGELQKTAVWRLAYHCFSNFDTIDKMIGGQLRTQENRLFDCFPELKVSFAPAATE